jgi:hypothetical protein
MKRHAISLHKLLILVPIAGLVSAGLAACQPPQQQTRAVEQRGEPADRTAMQADPKPDEATSAKQKQDTAVPGAGEAMRKEQ